MYYILRHYIRISFHRVRLFNTIIAGRNEHDILRYVYTHATMFE